MLAWHFLKHNINHSYNLGISRDTETYEQLYVLSTFEGLLPQLLPETTRPKDDLTWTFFSQSNSQQVGVLT